MRRVIFFVEETYNINRIFIAGLLTDYDTTSRSFATKSKYYEKKYTNQKSVHKDCVHTILGARESPCWINYEWDEHVGTERYVSLSIVYFIVLDWN